MITLKNIFKCLLLSPLFFSTAFAVQSINVQTFNPSTSSQFVLLEDALKTEWPHIANYYFGANYNYVKDPLVVTDLTHVTQTNTIIDSLQTYDFFFGFKPDKQLGIYFGLPIHNVTYSTLANSTIPGLSGNKTVIGDAKVMAKVRLNRDDKDNTAWALIPEFHLPTGNTENFVSDGSTYIALRMAVERAFERFTLGVNVGFATAANAVYQSLDFRNRMLLGVGGYLPFTDKWGMSLEFNSMSPIPFNNYTNPNEFYGGLRYVATDNTIFTLGASLGKISGPTGMAVRIIAGVRFTLYDEEEQPRAYTPSPAPVVAAATPAPTPMVVAKPATAAAVEKSAPKAVLVGKKIELMVPVNFEFGKDRLTLDGKEVLDEVVFIISSNKAKFKKILVDGHTDNVGSPEFNMKLSFRRAKAVKNYLVKRGIAANKLEARGFGLTKPKVSYQTLNAADTNRRVEFTLVN